MSRVVASALVTMVAGGAVEAYVVGFFNACGKLPWAGVYLLGRKGCPIITLQWCSVVICIFIEALHVPQRPRGGPEA